MFTAEDYKGRIARAAGTAIRDDGGVAWYLARDMCQALCLDYISNLPRIRKENKWRRYVYQPGWRSKWVLYLNRAGVETLIMLRGGLPRAELLEALDNATPPPDGEGKARRCKPGTDASMARR